MAKINIAGVRKGDKNFTVHVILTEPRDIEGQTADLPIGEAFVAIPHGTEMPDIKDRIVDAAQGVMKAHRDAQDKRKDIEELEFPEVE